jgi:ankyrin repeat protein
MIMNNKTYISVFLAVGITMSLLGMEEPSAKKQKTEDEQKALNKQLWKVAEKREEDIEKAQKLIEDGADINAFSKNKSSKTASTPLYNALSEERMDMVRFLVKQGADVNKGESNGTTALHVLFCGAGSDCAQEEIEFFLTSGADVNAANDNGITVFAEVAEVDCSDNVKLLMQYGANVHAVDNEGFSVLKHALINIEDHTQDERKIIKALLLAGAQFNANDAQEVDHIKEIFKEQPLLLAVLLGHKEQIELTCAEQEGVKKIQKALAYAVAQGNLPSTLTLLKNGIMPEQALHILSRVSQRYFTPALKAKYKALKKQLIRRLSLKDQVINKLKVWLEQERIDSKQLTSLPVELQVEINPTEEQLQGSSKSSIVQ